MLVHIPLALSEHKSLWNFFILFAALQPKDLEKSYEHRIITTNRRVDWMCAAESRGVWVYSAQKRNNDDIRLVGLVKRHRKTLSLDTPFSSYPEHPDALDFRSFLKSYLKGLKGGFDAKRNECEFV